MDAAYTSEGAKVYRAFYAVNSGFGITAFRLKISKSPHLPLRAIIQPREDSAN
jgi:hypothetical protein